MGKRNKTEIKFNPDDRKEFLTGFKKRKDVRRSQAILLLKEKERIA